ncbi:MAG: demethylmenaquinone methyltransferase [Candidatus Nitrosocaldaceae archaeon]|nr:MAG: demethylmenaquinone methyltransferase [Candidatus Nitrosocaldaceae archaeon]
MRYELVKKFFSKTSLSYDKIVAITTFNMDARWKEYMLSLIPENNRCLDLACGTGILTSMLKRKSRDVIGLDIIYNSLIIAKVKGNEVLQGAAEYLPFKDNSIDIITASYLPKYCDPELTIMECARVLRDQGLLIMHDFTYPSGVMRILWIAYFKILKFIGFFIPSWKDVFNELDKVIADSNWISDLSKEMEKNGFSDIRFISLTMNTAGILYARLNKP